MILRIIFKISLLDDDENVIKEKDYGSGYLADFDITEATEDWWNTHLYNKTLARLPGSRKKKFSREASESYKIVDILVNKFRRTLFGRFLCDKDEVAKRIQKEFDTANKGDE
jgi:hypothetical protein